MNYVVEDCLNINVDLVKQKKHMFKRRTLTKPIIQNLELVDVTPTLLKELQIVDPDSPLYQKNKDKMDPNCQIIMGEVIVNNVTFPICFVISKDEKIFDDLTSVPIDKRDEYRSKITLEAFEKYIIDSFTHLSCVDKEILELIKNKLKPKLIFKSRKEFDFKLSGTKVACVSGVKPIMVNLFTPNYFPIIHEFGHLFDRALNITMKSADLYKKLAQKYGKSLEETTWCGGESLSGYQSEEYEKEIGEFFADLFVAYYASDKLLDGSYLVEFFEKEAFELLDGIISKEKNKIKLINIKLFLIQARMRLVRLNDMRNYYESKNDIEMLNIIDEVMRKIGIPNNSTNFRILRVIANAIRLFDQNKDINRELIKNNLLNIINLPYSDKIFFKMSKEATNDEELFREEDEEKSNALKNELFEMLNNLELKVKEKFKTYSPLIKERILRKIKECADIINTFSTDGLSLIEYKIMSQRLQLLDKTIDDNIIISSGNYKGNKNISISTIRENVRDLYESLEEVINQDNKISLKKKIVLKKIQLLIEKYLELISDSNFVEYLKKSDTVLNYYNKGTLCYENGTIYDIVINNYIDIESSFCDLDTLLTFAFFSQEVTLFDLIKKLNYDDLVISYQRLEDDFYNMLSLIPRETSIKF